jgi:hypothetical protein
MSLATLKAEAEAVFDKASDEGKALLTQVKNWIEREEVTLKAQIANLEAHGYTVVTTEFAKAKGLIAGDVGAAVTAEVGKVL